MLLDRANKRMQQLNDHSMSKHADVPRISSRNTFEDIGFSEINNKLCPVLKFYKIYVMSEFPENLLLYLLLILSVI